MMQRWLSMVWLYLALACSSVDAAEPAAEESAAETAEEVETDAAGDEDESDTAEPDNAGNNSAAGNIVDFVPTVQISEDLSVSFPTDI